MPIDRTYKGSNFYSNTQFKTTRRPAWMNFCIVQTEKNSNAALRGYETPIQVKSINLKFYFKEIKI